MRKPVIFSGILLACGVVLFIFYHAVNILPPDGMSYNTQAISVFEEAACEKCHNADNEIFSIGETVERLRKDTAIDGIALAKIEYATVLYPSMPPPVYCLTHWGSAINPAKKKLLQEWVAYQRNNYYGAPAVSEQFVNEPVRPVQQPENIDRNKAELGRKLFFDKRLSADSSVSCSTCHRPEAGGADSRQHSPGFRWTLTSVNTPTVYNACFHFKQFRDGRAPDLHSQLADHLLDPSIMGNTSIEEVIKRLNNDGLTQSSLFESITEYEKTLVTADSRFDKYLRGSLQSLDEAEKTGYGAFKRNKCATCHSGTLLGGQSIEKLGIHRDYYKDRGWQPNKKDNARLKTPSLRNVALTKPYFHDGSQQTLHDAVKSMAKYQSGTKLNDEDTKAIVLFLNTLTE